MFPWWNMEKHEKEPSGYYWQLELTEDTFQTLERLLQGEKVTERAIERLKTCILFARQFKKVDLPLVGLPWGKLKERAKARHSSEVDAIWDWERK